VVSFAPEGTGLLNRRSALQHHVGAALPSLPCDNHPGPLGVNYLGCWSGRRSIGSLGDAAEGAGMRRLKRGTVSNESFSRADRVSSCSREHLVRF
jgi:hypothetical protein